MVLDREEACQDHGGEGEGRERVEREEAVVSRTGQPVDEERQPAGHRDSTGEVEPFLRGVSTALHEEPVLP